VYAPPMSNRAWSIWATGAWITPALVAGALGWKGIWGSTSAFGDYLVPLPIAGGALHVPSFALALLAVKLWPRLPPGVAGLLRGTCLGTALVGAAMLVDLDDVALAWTTDLEWRGVPWEKNPVGLFWLSDSSWALATMLRRPSPKTLALPALALALALPSAYATVRILGSRELSRPFVLGWRDEARNRWESIHRVYTRLPVDDPGFRDAARRFAAEHAPERDVNAEEVAFYFTDSLDAVEGTGEARVLTTLCLYEDGTPDRWEDGEADCFSDHVAFAERQAELAERIPRSTPRDVLEHLLLRELCAGFEKPDRYDDGLARVMDCYRFDPQASLEALVARYDRDALAAWGLEQGDAGSR